MFMSGYTDDQIVHEGVWEQSTVFLQKPFNSVELLRLVRQTLDN
jgi:two-component system cell cycle sensor histidine kinase/response regulator CckA